MSMLEKLVSGCETTEKIERACKIAAQQWKNVRVSLSLCGDIGEFCADDFMLGTISEDTIARSPHTSWTKSVSLYSPTYYPMYLVENLLGFAEEFTDKRYRSIKALYAYVEIVNIAAIRLGFTGTLAMGFASGYAHARTGWIAEKGLAEHRAVFTEMFFSQRPRNYEWDFHWNSVQRAFKDIYDKFSQWRDCPDLYRKETKTRAVVKPFIV